MASWMLVADPSPLAARLVTLLAERGISIAGHGDRVIVLPDRDVPRFEHVRPESIRAAVVVSSAEVYEPNTHHPGVAAEHPFPSLRNGNAIARRWRALEHDARAQFGDTHLVILRPPALPVAGGTDRFSRLFTSRRGAVPAGYNPSVQVLSIDDLADAIRCAIESNASGAFNLAPRGVAPLRDALRAAGVRALPMPRWTLRASHDCDFLDYLRYSWTVNGRRAEEDLGFRPRHSTIEALARLAGRTVTRAEPDAFGLDAEAIARWNRGGLRLLHDRYWRVEVDGIEHVPDSGAVVLAGVHRGFMPFDAIMALHGIATRRGRIPRFLIHPGLLKFPFIGDFITRLGGLIACRENAEWVLDRREILGVFPEGVAGAFRTFRDAHRLGPFTSDLFIRAAIRHRAPLIPFVTVGSAEAFPVVAQVHWRWWKRYSEWPCLPIPATLVPIPLPSRWHTRFLPPLAEAAGLPPEAADDPEIVRRLRALVREQLQSAIDDIRRRRPGVFFGAAFASKAGEDLD